MSNSDTKITTVFNIDWSQQFPISGRDLHMKLVIATPYHKWMPRMIDYGFVEDVDFLVTDIFVHNSNGGKQRQIDHQLTIDMAKHICMIQRSEIGKQIRQYFIEVEKDWHEKQTAQLRIPTTNEAFVQAFTSLVEHDKQLAVHDNRLSILESSYVNQQQTNAAIEDTLQKQQQQIIRIATKTATVPDEYPPVNITERNRMSRKAGALCKFIGETTGNTVGEIQNSLKAQIVSLFEDQFQISLYAVLEEAKKWYMYHYISLKSEDPNNVPHDVLRPKDIKSLSLYAAISLNKSWIDYFDQVIDNAFENYREEVESDV